jgi:uncharacterized membrane protein YccC
MEQKQTLQFPLRVKESIKTGLAMAIACGIAMGLGWANPYWACIAVAMVSLPTVGESLNKSVQRLGGTLVGGMFGLLILGLFPQDRWVFVACLSLYMGLCANRMTVSRFTYFWFISGYIAVLLATTVGASPQHEFNTAVLRILETSLGIIVYALVSVFLWPQHSAHDLKLLLKTLIGVQTKILKHYFSLKLRGDATNYAEPGYGLEALLVGQLKRRLDAAELEQLEIQEVRGWWRQLASQFQALMEAMEVWRESFPALRQLNLEELLPTLPAIREALELRFKQLRDIVDGAPTKQEPVAVELAVDNERLRTLSHFQRAAVLNTHAALEQIESISRSMVESLLAIMNPRRKMSFPPTNPAPIINRQSDPDSFAAVVRAMSAVWLASVVWIYVDPPGHSMFLVFVVVHVLLGIMIPQMNWVIFLFANITGVIFAGILYVFVMSNISGYIELFLLLFLLTFIICYVFYDQRLIMLKLGGLVPFVLLTNIQNNQTYDFGVFSNNAASMLMGILCATVIFYIPFYPRPEKMFLRVTARYFRQARQFMSLFDTSPKRSNRYARMMSALSAMQSSVSKVGGWANSVDYQAFPANPAEKSAAIVQSLNTITYRFMMLADARNRSQPLWEHFSKDILAWRGAIEELLQSLARDPLQEGVESGRQSGLETERIHLESRIEDAFQTLSGALEDEGCINVYHLLGGLKGVYEALAVHAALSADFKWERWRESSF